MLLCTYTCVLGIAEEALKEVTLKLVESSQSKVYMQFGKLDVCMFVRTLRRCVQQSLVHATNQFNLL